MQNKRVVAIAGASSGIGEAVALLLAEKGYSLSLTARREERLKSIKKKIETIGGIAEYFPVDMTKWDNAKQFIDGTVKIFGKVDVLFNNIGAGIKSAPFDELNIEEIDRGIAVNLIATLYGCRAVLPYMKKRKNGHIINTTSILGIRARSGLAVYTAAKHGVDGFSRALLNEVNDFGIRVSVLAPAAVKTAWAEKAGIDITNPETFLSAESVAKVVWMIIELSTDFNVWNTDIISLDQKIDPL
ncbi:MAG: SDR family oxidoreductase [Spirochaetales bacterium]|nr:SDR family oxidoreductase [Spirochaetales bacterium]